MYLFTDDGDGASGGATQSDLFSSSVTAALKEDKMVWDLAR